MRLKNTADNFSASFHITPPYQMVVIHSSKLIYPRELYQRGIQRKRVELIAKDFNEYTANEPKVSFRNGRYYVTDGQHTIEARILRNGGKDLPILCKIYTGLTMQQEALFFAEQNGHAAPLTAGIKLRAKVVGEDAPSVAFLAATNRVGLDFNYDSLQLSDYRISCVGTALKLYNQMGEKIYCEALRLIVAAWDGKPDSFRASVLRGVMHFVELYHGEFSEERLIRALGNVHPMEIYRVGRDNPQAARMEEIRFPHLHGLQRQRSQGRSVDEVLKHILSAKGHLQAADVPCYILKITIYRSDDTMVDKFSQVAGNVPVTNNDPNRRYTVINGYPVVLNFAKEPNPGVFERVRDILLATSYTKKIS